jgi:hypothetical protein
MGYINEPSPLGCTKDISILKCLSSKEGGCRNLSLGFATKAKALQGCGPRGSPGIKARGSLGVTSHTLGSVKKCEGV